MEMGELENEEDAAQDVQDVGSGDECDLADPEVCVCECSHASQGAFSVRP
jgi:hypothetical protein